MMDSYQVVHRWPQSKLREGLDEIEKGALDSFESGWWLSEIQRKLLTCGYRRSSAAVKQANHFNSWLNSETFQCPA